jgi:hypothetical protein
MDHSRPLWLKGGVHIADDLRFACWAAMGISRPAVIPQSLDLAKLRVGRHDIGLLDRRAIRSTVPFFDSWTPRMGVNSTSGVECGWGNH